MLAQGQALQQAVHRTSCRTRAHNTRTPPPQVSSDETERLIKMEEVLHGRVIGQEEAVSAIARAIRRARVGLKNPNRPIASFIFAGPTGACATPLQRVGGVLVLALQRAAFANSNGMDAEAAAPCPLRFVFFSQFACVLRVRRCG